MASKKFDVTDAWLRSFLDFFSPEPNDKCDVNDSNWPGVRIVKHGDKFMKSESSKSATNK